MCPQRLCEVTLQVAAPVMPGCIAAVHPGFPRALWLAIHNNLWILVKTDAVVERSRVPPSVDAWRGLPGLPTEHWERPASHNPHRGNPRIRSSQTCRVAASAYLAPCAFWVHRTFNACKRS